MAEPSAQVWAEREIFMSDNGMNCGHHGIWGKGNGTMPQNSPGGMGRQQSADILAYILQRANASAGNTELSPGADAKGMEEYTGSGVIGFRPGRHSDEKKSFTISRSRFTRSMALS